MTLVDDTPAAAVQERLVGAGRPRRQTAPAPAADDAAPAVGVAELREEAPVAEDAGAPSTEVNGGGPTHPPRRGRHRYRPDPPPPRWMRLALYGAMMIVAFLLGYLCEKVWRLIDHAVWVDQPLWGSA